MSTKPSYNGYAFVVLLKDADDANGLARLLEDVRLPGAKTPAVFVAPPVRGVDFFADEAKQAELDAWWGENVPRDALPVYLAMHEEGLAGWIHGLDGTFYVGLPKPDVADGYDLVPQLITFAATGPLDFAATVMKNFSKPKDSADGEELIFDEGEAQRMAALSSDFPLDLDEPPFDLSQVPADPGAFPPTPFPGQDPFAPSPFSSPFGPTPGAPAPVGPPLQQFDDMLSGYDPAGFPASPFGPAPPGRPPAFPASPMTGAGAGVRRPAPFSRPPRQAPPTPTTPNPFDLLSQTSAPAAPPSGPVPVMEGSVPESAGLLPAAPTGASAHTDPLTNPAAPTYSATPPDKKQKKVKGPRISFPAWPRKGTRTNFVATPNSEFASILVDRGPTIVVMGSRKGGVGKTSYAAGVAIVAGTVLDTVGHKAAIVDANIANPDAWGQMNLREGAATVREAVAALTANREPPPPVHSKTPALACYPESRETTEYSKTDVRRFAEYLRRRYTFIVVDMSNRLPDPMGGPEAAAAAYWLEHADVLVLPTTSSKQDFNGVLDYLDVRDLPPTVVPYIIPGMRRNREHPVTQQYLAVIRDRVDRIVEIPDEADKVRFAGMEGVPVEQVSPSLRSAYRELTEVIARVPPRVRSS